MKPIIFSTPMVAAILDNRKSMTRRVIKPQPEGNVWWCTDSFFGDHFYDSAKGSDVWLKPRYQEGDALYVRETWTDSCGMLQNALSSKSIHYCADCKPGNARYESMFIHCSWKKKPSIHMPKAAARIFLRVADVSVDRLWDISYEDIQKEGWRPLPEISDDMQVHRDAARDWFMDLWNDINSKRGYPWESNPWVWVYEFERAEKSEVEDG